MARFILLWVPDNDKVEPLMERLRMSSAVKIVGLFADPTKFCDLSCGRTPNGDVRTSSITIHPVWGTPHCGKCGKVILKYVWNLRNALDEKYLDGKYTSFNLLYATPDDGSLYNGRTPREIYGDEEIDARIESRRRLAQYMKDRAAGIQTAAQQRAARRRARRNRT